MATFYLLPARLQLGREFGEFLAHVFPGLEYPRSMWTDLAEALGAAAQCHEDVYVVYAEDLPEGVPLDAALEEYFGMEPGDQVVAVRPGAALRDIDAHHWIHELKQAA